MKSNIDLTENFDFGMSNRFEGISSEVMFTHNRKSLGKYISKHILDIPCCINEDIEHRQSGNIIQGNGNRRKYISIINGCEPYCERCGCKKKYPWENFSNLLCPKCEIEMGKDISIPWKR